jgi:SAM-dependent methyltransferase
MREKLPDIPRLFDRAALRARRRRAAASAASRFLVEHVAREAIERLSAVLRDFPVAIDLATPDNALAEALAKRPGIETIIRIEPEPSVLAGSSLAVAAWPDALPLAEGSADLVASALGLSAVDDLPGTLLQIRRALKPDGLFLAALFGTDTLMELRQSFAEAEAECEGGISPRVAPFGDVRALGALLQRAGFALPVADSDRLTVRYADPLALLRDLRAEGLANPLAERSRKFLRRRTLFRAIEIYAERFADADGRIRATFEIVWLSGWAPHPSQQKPLRPGSAQRRLADALGTTEFDPEKGR